MSARVFVVVLAVLLIVAMAAFLRPAEYDALPGISPQVEAKPKLRCPDVSTVPGDVPDLTGETNMWTPARPTHPPVLAKRTDARFTREAWDRCISGVVIVGLLVGADGKVKYGRVLRGLPLGLDASAAEATRDWQFIPAVTGATAVPAATTAVVWFNPNSRSQQPAAE